MFVMNGRLVTPELTDTILEGITRDCVLTIARDMGLDVEERRITVHELLDGIPSGTVTEAFGVGTAAAVAPIGAISIDGTELSLSIQPDNISMVLKKRLQDIRLGLAEDVHGWMHIVG